MLPKETAPHYHGVIIESARQKGLLERVAQGCQAMVEQKEPLEWLAMEGRAVLDALGELTGEVTTEDLFEQMFSQFCVGK